jgi:lipid II:glycine glycyltransferase (peptidoglycan interpeptide bridge formation enzyme)
LDDYNRLINENRKRNKLQEYNIKTFRLGTTSFPPNIYIIIVSYQGDVALSGQIVFIANNTLNLWGVSVSDYAKQSRIYANEVVQYYVVKMAFDLGIRYIDWGGAAPYSSDKKIQSIDKFKSKWLGNLVSFPVNQKGYKF